MNSIAMISYFDSDSPKTGVNSPAIHKKKKNMTDDLAGCDIHFSAWNSVSTARGTVFHWKHSTLMITR